MALVPDVIGQYKILDYLGTGGLGERYRTRDTKRGHTVAITILSDSIVEDRARLDPLLRAARSAAAVSHPNIAALIEIGPDGPLRYLAFEFVPGERLSAILRGRPLHVRRAVDFAIQLAAALAEAEGHELSHGNVCADTVVITPNDRPKLIDFGLAEFTAGGADRRATGPRIPINDGTPRDRQGVLDDIYGLGIVMFEMLTGRQFSTAQSAGPVTSAASINKAVPSELDDVVRKALTEDCHKRYQTAVTLAAELRAVAAILDARAALAAETDRSGTPHGHRRLLTTVTALTVLAGLVFWIWHSAAWRLAG
jgi:serine/threonine-protein kinase